LHATDCRPKFGLAEIDHHLSRASRVPGQDSAAESYRVAVRERHPRWPPSLVVFIDHKHQPVESKVGVDPCESQWRASHDRSFFNDLRAEAREVCFGRNTDSLFLSTFF